MQKKINKSLIINLILTILAIIGFTIITILVCINHTFVIDNFNIIIANNRTNFWSGFFKIFTYLGSFYVLAILALIAVVLIWFVAKNKRTSLFYAVCFAVVCISNLLLKILIQRIRPDLMIINEVGYSFPSGHAMMSFAFFVLAMHYVYKFVKNKPLKILLISVFALIIVLIGFSRIYLGVHYLTDIIAGWLISFVIIQAFILLTNSKLFSFLKDK